MIALVLGAAQPQVQTRVRATNQAKFRAAEALLRATADGGYGSVEVSSYGRNGLFIETGAEPSIEDVHHVLAARAEAAVIVGIDDPRDEYGGTVFFVPGSALGRGRVAVHCLSGEDEVATTVPKSFLNSTDGDVPSHGSHLLEFLSRETSGFTRSRPYSFAYALPGAGYRMAFVDRSTFEEVLALFGSKYSFDHDALRVPSRTAAGLAIDGGAIALLLGGIVLAHRYKRGKGLGREPRGR